MSVALDISGQRFGRLLAVKPAGSVKGQRFWICSCECGGSTTVRVAALRSGNTSSCGCRRREVVKTAFIKHGAKLNRTPSPEYVVWSLMRDRCNNPLNKSYAYYGGRGISVAPAWDDFAVFLRDMGSRPPGMTIDREDSSGNYEPSNCRWATRKEQSRNRVYCKRVQWLGEERLLLELADQYGIPLQTVHQRLHRGWSLEKTFTQPIRGANHA